MRFPQGKLRSSSLSRDYAVAWARKVGFPESQVDWAATCAVMLKDGRKGGVVRASEVRAHLGASHPHIFNDEHQQRLFDEPY